MGVKSLIFELRDFSVLSRHSLKLVVTDKFHSNRLKTSKTLTREIKTSSKMGAVNER